MRFLPKRLSLSFRERGDNSSGELSNVQGKNPTAKFGGMLNGKGRPKLRRGGKNKSVTFNESLNQCDKIPANEGHSKECWYTLPEFMEIQSSVRSLFQTVKGIRREKAESQYFSVLSNTYKSCGEVEDEGLLKSGILKPVEKERLVLGLTHSSVIGLERSVVELIAINYGLRRMNMWQKLNELQNALPSSDLKEEIIRRSMEPMSLQSRLFAREMGRALQSVSSEWVG